MLRSEHKRNYKRQLIQQGNLPIDKSFRSVSASSIIISLNNNEQFYLLTSPKDETYEVPPFFEVLSSGYILARYNQIITIIDKSKFESFLSKLSQTHSFFMSERIWSKGNVIAGRISRENSMVNVEYSFGNTPALIGISGEANVTEIEKLDETYFSDLIKIKHQLFEFFSYYESKNISVILEFCINENGIYFVDVDWAELWSVK